MSDDYILENLIEDAFDKFNFKQRGLKVEYTKTD